jgi:hypothetical protein
MRTLRKLSLVALAAGALLAAGADDAPRGVVTVAYDGVPQRVHPVAIQQVDGKEQPHPYRDTHFLPAGKHSFRLAPVFTDAANIQRGNSGRRDAAASVLEIEVEAGKRYVIGAKLEGRKASDWKPIVLRVEDVGS